MKNINNDIEKNEYKSIYLLYGEEEYLKKQFRDKLKNAIVPDDGGMNYNYFEGKDIKVNEIVSIAGTVPFFAERRLIVVENSGFFKTVNEAINELINELPETTTMVFVESQVDKRIATYKTVADKGYICELNYQTEAMLSKWIAGRLKEANMTMTPDVIALFLSATGNDMTNIANELEKLITYALGKDRITSRDVETLVVEQINGKIFDMIDAIGAKNTKKALGFYKDLIAIKEPPMRIMYMLARQFNIMLKVKELGEAGYGKDEIAGKIGIASFIVGKTLRQISVFSMKMLRDAIEDCVSYEEDVKNGRLDDMASVEMIIIKYSR